MRKIANSPSTRARVFNSRSNRIVASHFERPRSPRPCFWEWVWSLASDTPPAPNLSKRGPGGDAKWRLKTRRARMSRRSSQKMTSLTSLEVIAWQKIDFLARRVRKRKKLDQARFLLCWIRAIAVAPTRWATMKANEIRNKSEGGLFRNLPEWPVEAKELPESRALEPARSRWRWFFGLGFDRSRAIVDWAP